MPYQNKEPIRYDLHFAHFIKAIMSYLLFATQNRKLSAQDISMHVPLGCLILNSSRDKAMLTRSQSADYEGFVARLRLVLVRTFLHKHSGCRCFRACHLYAPGHGAEKLF